MSGNPPAAVISGRMGSAIVRAVLEQGDACRYRVSGRSMWPFLRDGDLVTIARPERSVRRGDVVAFSHPESGRILFHRVLRTRPDALRTKGDNLLRSDGWIPRERLLGIVTERRRGSRIRAFGSRRASDAVLAPVLGLLWPAARAVLRLPLRLIGRTR